MAHTIVIGDVHGCADELERLLERLAVTSADRVVFVGDLVARGPDSRRVLAIVRRLRAVSVRGNHEQRLLDARRALARGRRPALPPGHLRLLRELRDEDWAQLEGMPLYLELPEHGAVVVHAGVVPGRPLAEQQLRALTRMRSLTLDGLPSERVGEASWVDQYHSGDHVVFGHNSWRRLQLGRYATGLDTACVYGGALTALRLGADEVIPTDPNERRRRLVSVSAARPYFAGAERG